MNSPLVPFHRRRSASARHAALGLLLLAQALSCGHLAAVETVTVNALKVWSSVAYGGHEDYYFAAGIAVGPFGDVYVLRAWPGTVVSRVEQFTFDGVFLRKWGAAGSSSGVFRRPTGIAVDLGTEDVYVVDASQKLVEKFDRNGKFLKEWGRYGTGAGEFDDPTCIAVGPDHSIYVGDAVNNNVQKFDANGVFRTSWKLERGPGPGQNLPPRAIAVSPKNEVFVLGPPVSSSEKNLLRFNTTGHLLASWNTLTPDRSSVNPVAIAVNGLGAVVVADGNNPYLQVFNTTGRYEFAIAVNDAKGRFEIFRSLAFYHDDYLFCTNRLDSCKVKLF
jgi:DNA-binding beta-propeller fold protein YncE